MCNPLFYFEIYMEKIHSAIYLKLTTVSLIAPHLIQVDLYSQYSCLMHDTLKRSNVYSKMYQTWFYLHDFLVCRSSTLKGTFTFVKIVRYNFVFLTDSLIVYLMLKWFYIFSYRYIHNGFSTFHLEECEIIWLSYT